MWYVGSVLVPTVEHQVEIFLLSAVATVSARESGGTTTMETAVWRFSMNEYENVDNTRVTQFLTD